MAKFKVGDRVRVIKNYDAAKPYLNKIGVIYDTINVGYLLQIDGIKLSIYFTDEMLELVEPKVESTYKKPLVFHAYNEHDVMVGGEVRKFITTDFRTERASVEAPLVLTIKMVEKTEPLEGKDMAFNVNLHEIEGKKSLKDCSDKELIEIISKSFDDFYKNLDFTKSFPYYHLSLDEALHTRPSKNRIPDRVVFNQDKGKVTVLISKHLDGVAPYWAYTSKVHVESGDKFDAQFGFLLSYYKYLIRRFDLKVQKEMIERIFKILKERRYVYLLGVVENEVLKINGVESYKDWEDIYLAITDPSNAKNVYDYTWDYLEWKEMLRVHELETKREEQKAIRKEIKKHEQEIEKLKKKGV